MATTQIIATPHTEDLGISGSERALGIVAMQAVTYKRATVVFIETEDELIVTGTNVPWPDQIHVPHLGLASARQRAIDALIRCRGRTTEYRAR